MMTVLRRVCGFRFRGRVNRVAVRRDDFLWWSADGLERPTARQLLACCRGQMRPHSKTLQKKDLLLTYNLHVSAKISVQPSLHRFIKVIEVLPHSNGMLGMFIRLFDCR